jgi:uncharacterized protein (TIGR00297 family)
VAAELRTELTRKAVHVAMGGVALTLRWLTPWQAVGLAAGALIFNLLVLHRLTRRSLLREGERARGFSWGIALYPGVVLGLILVFHDRLELAAATWGLLAFGDGMATVSGLLLGGPRLGWNRDKTWAGLIAFVLYGTLAAAFLLHWTQLAVLDAVSAGAHPGPAWIGSNAWAGGPGTSGVLYLIAGCFAAAVAAAFAESLDTGLDDNLLVPIVGGAVLWVGTVVEPGRLAAAGTELTTQFVWGAAINGGLALAAYAARGVSRSGAVWGWALGTALYTFAGWPGFAMLLLFFVLGTGSTKTGFSRKHDLGVAQEKGGRRGARNAFANTSTGVAFAFLAIATPFRDACTLAMVAAFATATNDTVSSEIGQAFGKRHYLVTSFRRVAAGTDGAVSVEGTLSGILGGAVLALVAWSLGLVTANGALIATVAAFVGATAESYLGATVEQVRHLDNELVNFANTLVGALAALGLWGLVG